MKLLALILISSAGIGAQVRPAARVPVSGFSPKPAASRIVVPSSGALGGSYASVGISRPLGGIAPPSFPGTGAHRRKGTSAVTGPYRYVGPVYYVPNAFDTVYDASPALEPVPVSLSSESAPPPRPIIIKQYFSTASPEQMAVSPVSPATNPGDPIGPVDNYYLIAYRNHAVYTALAYWIEGDTLHYVTTQNTHNQASMALIDEDETAKLNGAPLSSAPKRD